MYEMEGAHSAKLHHAFRLLVLARALLGRPPASNPSRHESGYPIPDKRPRIAPERLRLAPEGPFLSLFAAGDN